MTVSYQELDVGVVFPGKEKGLAFPGDARSHSGRTNQCGDAGLSEGEAGKIKFLLLLPPTYLTLPVPLCSAPAR